MITKLNVMSIYVLDKEEALDFYVNQLGLEKGNDDQQGSYRWLTVRVPGDGDTEISLEQPGPPLHDEATAEQLRELITKGALGGLVLDADFYVKNAPILAAVPGLETILTLRNDPLGVGDSVAIRLSGLQVGNPHGQRIAPADGRVGLLRLFDMVGEFARGEDFRGCPFLNAASELADPSHPGYAVMRRQREWLYGLIRGLLSAAGVRDLDRVSRAVVVLHDGALASAVLDGDSGAAATARFAVERLLDVTAPFSPPRARASRAGVRHRGEVR